VVCEQIRRETRLRVADAFQVARRPAGVEVAGDRARFDRHGRLSAAAPSSSRAMNAQLPAAPPIRRRHPGRVGRPSTRSATSSRRAASQTTTAGSASERMYSIAVVESSGLIAASHRLVRRDVDDRCLEPVGEYRRHALFGFESNSSKALASAFERRSSSPYVSDPISSRSAIRSGRRENAAVRSDGSVCPFVRVPEFTIGLCQGVFRHTYQTSGRGRIFATSSSFSRDTRSPSIGSVSRFREVNSTTVSVSRFREVNSTTVSVSRFREISSTTVSAGVRAEQPLEFPSGVVSIEVTTTMSLESSRRILQIRITT